MSFGFCVALAFSAGACKHESSSATTSASASAAPVDSASEATRAARFASELSRAQKRWQEKPEVGDCAKVLQEKPDQDLCLAATNALGAVEALDPAVAPASALPVLADGALALTRLLERARFLTMEDMSRRRMEGDAGTAAPASASARAPSAPSIGAPFSSQRVFRLNQREHKSIHLSDSPIAHLLENTSRLEHDVLRQFSAYLEYAPLSVRTMAYERAKQLSSQHPKWPTLSHVLREASVLETDPDLKSKLNELSVASFARARPPAQATGSK
ncbi:MAG TPA: hypothetical protein VHV51_04100 [Polyangiaceae bacterium]|nr:hypothetical protein [Polyangiaceae bacterium]